LSKAELTIYSPMLLSDDCLKGLLAHEFGHFSNCDPAASLFTYISNFALSYTMKILIDIKDKLDGEEKRGLIQSVFKVFFDLFYYVFKGLQFVGDLFLMRLSRKNEYKADNFARKIGFGVELTDVLIEMYYMTIERPKSVKEQLRATHPHITLRIEQLEKVIY